MAKGIRLIDLVRIVLDMEHLKRAGFVGADGTINLHEEFWKDIPERANG